MAKSGRTAPALRENGRLYTKGEEIANTVTHAAGGLLAVGGTAAAVVCAALYGDLWCVTGAALYGATLILLYAMSSLYHAITNVRAKKVFRVFDHCSIFLLIAGTYTPYTLVTLRGTLGWVLFGVVWGCAALGVTLNAVSLEKFKVFSMIAYVGMGWVVLAAIVPLARAMAPGGVALLIAGGAAYTGGIVFYAKRRRYWHAVWHLFVLAGSVLHYFSILFYVITPNLA